MPIRGSSKFILPLHTRGASPYFLMAFQLPLTWIQESLDLVVSTLEQVNPGVTEETEQRLVV